MHTENHRVFKDNLASLAPSPQAYPEKYDSSMSGLVTVF